MCNQPHSLTSIKSNYEGDLNYGNFKGVEMLHLEFHGNIIHPTLLWDQEMAVLIDTGFPGQIEDLRVAMEKVGVSFDKLKVIILTHQDIDHIGSLPEILQEFGSNIKVYAHELDKPYIQGDLPLLKDGHIENPPKGKVNDTLDRWPRTVVLWRDSCHLYSRAYSRTYQPIFETR